MISHRFVALTRLDRIPRRPGVADRAIALATTARLVDEVLSGAWLVLTPTFRQVFGLTLVQVGLLSQVLGWVALVVEPPAAALVDLRSRRALLALGGIAVGVATVAIGLAPGYGALLLGFALYGIGSGPLVHTADVVVVEAFPGAEERAFNRATLLDTGGALAGPAVVAVALGLGLSWRWPLAALGVLALGHGWAAATTAFPAPPGRHDGGDLARTLATNVARALRHREARRALLVLFCFDVVEAAFVLQYVWLEEQVGLGQAAVAAYAVGEEAVGLVALAWLDRWLAHHDGRQVLRAAAAALVVLPAAWVAAPAGWGTVAVGVPLAAALALVWPVARARSLTAVPELAGATSAITTLFPVVPLALLQAGLAQAVGIGPAMAVTAGAAAGAMVLATRQAPPGPPAATGGPAAAP